jgi:transcriptional regulator with XRE-family HTH domain
VVTEETARGTIGGRLKAARLRLAWSREALAYNAGLSWSAIEQIESGRRNNLTLKTLSGLSGALGVPIDYLVRGFAAPPRLLKHLALFYDGDDGFASAACAFVVEGIEREEAVLVVTSEAHIDLLKGAAAEEANRIQFAEASHWYELPVPAMMAFRAFIEDALAQGHHWARIIAEPVQWSGSSESIGLLDRCESVINLAFGSAPATILCPYNAQSIDERVVSDMKRIHPEVLEGNALIENPLYQDPSAFVIKSMP